MAILLAACSGTATVNVEATRTRATEQAQINALQGTVAALAGSPVATAAGTPGGVSRTLTVSSASPSAAQGLATRPVTATAGVSPTRAVTQRGPARPGVPALADMVLDEQRGRLYGTDQAGGKVLVLALPDLGTIASIDVGQAAKPSGLALSPDGAELAVALSGAGNVALIDTTSLQVVGKLLISSQSSDRSNFWAVLYTKPGRLYTTENGPGTLHIFDTPSRSEIGTGSSASFGGSTRMVATADGSIYVGETNVSPQNIYRIAPNDTAPTIVARGPHGPVVVPDLAVRRDGTAVYTAGGQVWTSNLQSQLGAFTTKGTCIDYAPEIERLFICLKTGVAEVEATGNYNFVAAYGVASEPRVARANAGGTAVYVSTDSGIEVLLPGPSPQAPTSAVPTPTPTFTPPAASTRTGGPTPTVTIGARFTPSKPGIPAFSDLVLDEAADRLYGLDKAGGRLIILSLSTLAQIGTIDLGQVSQPESLALSPNRAEIAVALTGAGNIALIDTATLTVAGKLLPTVEFGANLPWHVQYNPAGLLFSTGNPDSSGFDYIHVFDTKSRTEVGRSQDIIRAAPRLALAADGSIFIAEPGFSPQQLYRFALDGTIPKRVAQGPHGPVSGVDLAVRSDGSAIYTSGGQVWSSNLKSQLGAFNAKGSRIEYVPATERLFVCQQGAVIEVEATGNYNVIATRGVGTTAIVARANATGTLLYVSTDAGLVVIPLGATPSSSPKP